MKKSSCISTTLAMAGMLIFLASSMAMSGGMTYRFDENGIQQKNEAGGDQAVATMSTASPKIMVESQFNFSVGQTILSIPASGMELLAINGGSKIFIEILREGGWMPYDSAILSEGVYRFSLENQWGKVDFSLRGEVANPPSCLFTSFEVSREDFLDFFPGFRDFPRGIRFYLGYLPFLATTNVSRVAQIDATIITDQYGKKWEIDLFSISLSGEIIPSWKLSGNETMIFQNMVFALALR